LMVAGRLLILGNRSDSTSSKNERVLPTDLYTPQGTLSSDTAADRDGYVKLPESVMSV